MTQRNVVVMIDDLTGKELPTGTGETVTFSLDGVPYEIDVDSKAAKKLRTSLAPYIGAGRKTTGPRTVRRTRRSRTASDPATIRAWASANGLTVNTRGRIPASVIAQFEAAGH